MKYFTARQEDDTAPREDLVTLGNLLNHYNMDTLQVGSPNLEPLKIMVKDERGRVVAGLIGKTLWRALSIDVLFVHEDFRGRGLGSALLQEAENEARQRNCHLALLTTISARAKECYLKNGYNIIGKVPNFPAGHSTFELSKLLSKKTGEELKSSNLHKLTLVANQSVSKEEAAALTHSLRSHMAAQAGGADEEPLDILIRDENGTVLGGLIGKTLWGALNIDVFYVHPKLKDRALDQQF